MSPRLVLLVGAVLSFSAVQVAAHAAINPALGVTGTAVRNDVQRPSANKPCGNADLAAIDTSTAVTADASGSFTTTIQNFNGGQDGSRQVTVQVDAAGTGSNFVAGDVTANGVAAPANTGSEDITASLPAGTTCSGGASGNLCLASFKTLGGFGNCVVVQQGGAGANVAAGGAATAGGNANNATAPATAATNGQASQAATGKKGKGKGKKAKAKANNRRAAGTRMARAIAV
ncbi:hypothetical protein BDV96DRAFT_692413 [Lophiotrema nucula]|uniref:Uncharacterized protein n=1 Tax=Lophiotrema nucula TaxID=690887 RepID=A0A6A5YNB3_9PLEO|nr:hypothetical protein BDV96DRAFT_692413 [Lophiotrema nucula]